jgi:hypothetical protein
MGALGKSRGDGADWELVRCVGPDSRTAFWMHTFFMVGIRREEWNWGLTSDPDGQSSSACFLSFLRRFVSRAFRGAVSRTAAPPLFGRSKSGHTDGPNRQDGFTEGRTHCFPQPSTGGQHTVPREAPVVANAIGHIDDRAGVSARHDAGSSFRQRTSGVYPNPRLRFVLGHAVSDTVGQCHSCPPTPARKTVRPDASAVVAGSRRRTKEAHARRTPPSWGFPVPVLGAHRPAACGRQSPRQGKFPDSLRPLD